MEHAVSPRARAGLVGSFLPAAEAHEWVLTCEGEVAYIRSYEFDSALCIPGHSVRLVAVGADRAAAERFLSSLRAERDSGC